MGACNKLILFKLLELVLTGGCLGLHWYSLEHYETIYLLAITSVLGGYVIVLVGALLAAILGEPLPKRAWLVYSLAGIGLFAASGALAILYQTEDRVQGNINKAVSWFNEKTGNDDILQDTTKTYGLAKGSVAIANALTFFIDFICTFRSNPAE